MASKQPMVKVTIRLPEKLWKKTKIAAIFEDRNAQDIILDGLKLYYARDKKPPANTKGAR